MKYVAWAELATDPLPTGRHSSNGQPLYVVHYTEPAREFEQPVPREIMGKPIESWLDGFPRGRNRNVATFGRAVRPITDSDLARIFELAGAYPVELTTGAVDVKERVRVLSSRLRRDEQFRRQVIVSYEERCAVSGFALGSIAVTRSRGLLDAAHIRPIASEGTDRISNGLPLTPTLHRMFDTGLFTIAYQDGTPRIVVSPRLEKPMIESPDGKFVLRLEQGHAVFLPKDNAAWPDSRQLKFHQDRIFLAD
jgi:putative restriction endonuclease